MLCANKLNFFSNKQQLKLPPGIIIILAILRNNYTLVTVIFSISLLDLLADAGAPTVSELLAIKASRSSDVVMFPFPETAVAAAAAAAARSCLIFRPNALLNDAYKRRKRRRKKKETTIVSSKVQRQIRQIVTLT
jgi:hypothetical protein